MMTAEEILMDARQFGDALHIDLFYPRNDDSPIKRIVLGLDDVRAASDLRISYDFDRNGWKIERQYGGEDDEDHRWREVALINGGVNLAPPPP